MSGKKGNLQPKQSLVWFLLNTCVKRFSHNTPTMEAGANGGCPSRGNLVDKKKSKTVLCFDGCPNVAEEKRNLKVGKSKLESIGLFRFQCIIYFSLQGDSEYAEDSLHRGVPDTVPRQPIRGLHAV